MSYRLYIDGVGHPHTGAYIVNDNQRYLSLTEVALEEGYMKGEIALVVGDLDHYLCDLAHRPRDRLSRPRRTDRRRGREALGILEATPAALTRE